MAVGCLGNASGFAFRKEPVHVIKPQAATEPASRRVEGGVGKELQDDLSPAQDHPVLVAEHFDKADPGVEVPCEIEIALGQVRGRTIH